MGSLIVIKATWDPEANVFVAESEDVPGLVREAHSLEELRGKIARHHPRPSRHR
jgi:predicted RNase H-like HicB family nuclease